MLRPTSHMNPYLAGFLLGLVLLLSIYITGRGLGASGAFKSMLVQAVETVDPSHVENSLSYKEFSIRHPKGALKDWLFFEVIGMVIGAFVSGLIANRVGLNLEKGARSTNTIRIIGAITGGALFGFGSQLGRGCTSGAALSGMAVMSFGGIITMLAIFGSAYLFAYFFRKLWLK